MLLAVAEKEESCALSRTVLFKTNFHLFVTICMAVRPDFRIIVLKGVTSTIQLIYKETVFRRTMKQGEDKAMGTKVSFLRII